MASAPKRLYTESTPVEPFRSTSSDIYVMLPPDIARMQVPLLEQTPSADADPWPDSVQVAVSTTGPSKIPMLDLLDPGEKPTTQLDLIVDAMMYPVKPTTTTTPDVLAQIHKAAGLTAPILTRTAKPAPVAPQNKALAPENALARLRPTARPNFSSNGEIKAAQSHAGLIARKSFTAQHFHNLRFHLSLIHI